MIKIKFKVGMLIALVLCSFMILGAANPYEYPDNSTTVFNSPEKLTDSMKHGFELFKDADINIQEKMFFKDVYKVETDLNQKLSNIKMAPNYAPHIHPNRQVYFLGTVKDTKSKIELHYIVLDAETNKVIQERRSFKMKRNVNNL
jgi:hypothetical protein